MPVAVEMIKTKIPKIFEIDKTIKNNVVRVMIEIFV